MNCLYLLVLLCCCNRGRGRGNGCCAPDRPMPREGCARTAQEESCGCQRNARDYADARQGQGCCPDTVPEMDQPAAAPYPIYPDHCGCNNNR